MKNTCRKASAQKGKSCAGLVTLLSSSGWSDPGAADAEARVSQPGVLTRAGMLLGSQPWREGQEAERREKTAPDSAVPCGALESGWS